MRNSVRVSEQKPPGVQGFWEALHTPPNTKVWRTGAPEPQAYVLVPPARDDALRRKEDVMPEIILTFPVRRAAPQSRVWITTDNPSQALACRWMVCRKPCAGLAAHEVEEPEGRRLCA